MAPLRTRGCGESIGRSDIDEFAAGYVEGSIQTGPVLFGNAATFDEITAELGPDADGRFEAVKMPLTVAAGETVAVEIEPSSLGWAALLYDPTLTRLTTRYELSEGTDAVTFTACDEGDTSLSYNQKLWMTGCWLGRDVPS